VKRGAKRDQKLEAHADWHSVRLKANFMNSRAAIILLSIMLPSTGHAQSCAQLLEHCLKLEQKEIPFGSCSKSREVANHVSINNIEGCPSSLELSYIDPEQPNERHSWQVFQRPDFFQTCGKAANIRIEKNACSSLGSSATTRTTLTDSELLSSLADKVVLLTGIQCANSNCFPVRSIAGFRITRTGYEHANISCDRNGTKRKTINEPPIGRSTTDSKTEDTLECSTSGRHIKITYRHVISDYDSSVRQSTKHEFTEVFDVDLKSATDCVYNNYTDDNRYTTSGHAVPKDVTSPESSFTSSKFDPIPSCKILSQEDVNATYAKVEEEYKAFERKSGR